MEVVVDVCINLNKTYTILKSPWDKTNGPVVVVSLRQGTEDWGGGCNCEVGEDVGLGVHQIKVLKGKGSVVSWYNIRRDRTFLVI